MYCFKFFECKERPDTEYCLSFKPMDEEAEKRYKEWRNGKDRKKE